MNYKKTLTDTCKIIEKDDLLLFDNLFDEIYKCEDKPQKSFEISYKDGTTLDASNIKEILEYSGFEKKVITDIRMSCLNYPVGKSDRIFISISSEGFLGVNDKISVSIVTADKNLFDIIQSRVIELFSQFKKQNCLARLNSLLGLIILGAFCGLLITSSISNYIPSVKSIITVAVFIIVGFILLLMLSYPKIEFAFYKFDTAAKKARGFLKIGLPTLIGLILSVISVIYIFTN